MPLKPLTTIEQVLLGDRQRKFLLYVLLVGPKKVSLYIINNCYLPRYRKRKSGDQHPERRDKQQQRGLVGQRGAGRAAAGGVRGRAAGRRSAARARPARAAAAGQQARPARAAPPPAR